MNPHRSRRGVPHYRVLAILANPRGTDSLRLDAEDRVLRECVRLCRNRRRMRLDIRHAAQIHDVRRALLDEEYDVVHFSAHGNDDGLLLEDAAGNPQSVPPHALAELLTDYSPPIRCALLNACYSTRQGALIARGIPYVVAMDRAVADASAIEFSRGFYDALGAGKDIAFAFREGCRTIKLMGYPDSDTPSLFTS